MLKLGVMDNLLFKGPFGVGKTATATSVCGDADADVLFVNGSLDTGINSLREDLEPFASTYSFWQQRKVILIDEADGLSRQYQDGLRGFIERFSKNCSFILTTNYIQDVSDAIRSRSIEYDFTFTQTEARQMKKDFILRLGDILIAERAWFDRTVVSKIVSDVFPDFRQILKQVQAAARNFDRRNSDTLTGSADATGPRMDAP
jgi:DNA polymerase III delta prime subunit